MGGEVAEGWDWKVLATRVVLGPADKVTGAARDVLLRLPWPSLCSPCTSSAHLFGSCGMSGPSLHRGQALADSTLDLGSTEGLGQSGLCGGAIGL